MTEKVNIIEKPSADKRDASTATEDLGMNVDLPFCLISMNMYFNFQLVVCLTRNMHLQIQGKAALQKPLPVPLTQ